MKKIIGLVLLMAVFSSYATLVIYNTSNKTFASLRLLSGPYYGSCLTGLVQDGAYSQKGTPSRQLTDLELNAVCNNFPCRFQLHLGNAPDCSGFTPGSFMMSSDSMVTVLSQNYPNYALYGEQGLINVYSQP